MYNRRISQERMIPMGGKKRAMIVRIVALVCVVLLFAAVFIPMIVK